MTAKKLALKRVYDEAADDDGFRILVDRLWPRGVKKETAHIDLWLRDAAPSPALRKWFNHDPERWAQFRAAYLHELAQDPQKTAPIRTHAAKGAVTLLYGARDPAHNHALVLRDFLNGSKTHAA